MTKSRKKTVKKQEQVRDKQHGKQHEKRMSYMWKVRNKWRISTRNNNIFLMVMDDYDSSIFSGKLYLNYI